MIDHTIKNRKKKQKNKTIKNKYRGGNKTHIIEFKDGSKYYGEIDQFYLPNGIGKMEYNNGAIYDGKWDGNKKIGKGIIKYKNGSVYEGEWKNYLKEGKGSITYSNGEKYSGLWQNDFFYDMFDRDCISFYVQNGIKKKGSHFDIDCQNDNDNTKYEIEIEYKDETKYKGTLYCVKNELQGDGIINYSNGDVYEGHFSNGVKQETGKMIYANGDIYEGEWNDNLKMGQGEMIYENGDFYNGEWEEDLKNGQGEMVYENGDVYDGEWNGDDKNGNGTMVYENGDVYIGNWTNDTKTGIGQMTYANGDIYSGHWENNKKHKIGEMIYANGDKYDGEWDNDNINGEGIMKYANGEIYEGRWVNNKKLILKKPEEIKSAKSVTQLNGTCWAHSISRSVTRTLLLLCLIDGQDSDDMYIALYTYLINISDRTCDQGEFAIEIFDKFVDMFKKNPEKIFELQYKDIRCDFIIGNCKIDKMYKEQKILLWNEEKKNKFLNLFNKIQNTLYFNKYEYKFNYDQENLPSPEITNALKKKIQCVIVNHFIRHAFILRSWGKEYTHDNKNITMKKNRFCYKNTWKNDKNTCIDDIKEITKMIETSIILNLKPYITTYINSIHKIDNSPINDPASFINKLFFEIQNQTHKNMDIIIFCWLDFDLNKIKKIDSNLQNKIIKRMRTIYKNV